MAIESATYINELDTANPLHADGLSQTDSHLRLLKAVLKATFPNLVGACTLTGPELNSAFTVPVGAIMLWPMFNGEFVTPPTGFGTCDGLGGRPGISPIPATINGALGQLGYIVKLA